MESQESGVYVVETKSHRHCFASGLRAPLLKQTWSVSCYCINQDGRPSIYVSTLADVSSERAFRCLSLDRRFADRLGLERDDEVVVQSISAPSPCITASLEPLSTDDWEILELHASFVERQLLSQIRVLYPGLVFPFWISASIVVYLRTVSFEPAGVCTVLDRNTEVQVAPKLAAPPDTSRPTSSPARGGDKEPAVGNTALPSTSAAAAPAAAPRTASQTGAAGGGSTQASRSAVSSSLFNHIRAWSSSKISQVHESLASGNWAALSLEGGSVWSGDGGSGADYSANQSAAETATTAEATRYTTTDTPAAVDRHGRAVSSSVMLRVQPNPSATIAIPRCCLDQPSTVVVSCETWRKKFGPSSSLARAHQCNEEGDEVYVATLSSFQRGSSGSRWLRSVRPRTSPAGDSASDGRSASRLVTVRVLCSELLAGAPVAEGHVIPSHTLRRVMRIPSRSPVVACDVREPADDVSELRGIILRPALQSETSALTEGAVKEAFVAFVEEMTCEDHPWFATQHSVCSLSIDSHEVDVGVECIGGKAGEQGSRDPVFAVEALCLARLHIAVDLKAASVPSDALPLSGWASVDERAQLPQLSELGGVQCVASRGLQALLPFLTTSNGSAGCCQCGLLLCASVAASSTQTSTPGVGTKDSADASPSSAHVVFGRSSLAAAVARYAQESPALAHVEVLECLHLKGKRVDVVENKLRDLVEKCIECQPSVLVLDDIDVIIPSAESLPSDRRDLIGTSDRLAQAVCDLSDQLSLAGHRVALLATSATADTVHPALCRRVLHQSLVMPMPGPEERHDILLKLLRQSELAVGEQLDLRDIASKADGYVVGDLQHLVALATHNLACRALQAAALPLSLATAEPEGLGADSADHRLVKSDFEHAMASYTPALHQGVQAGKAESTTFADVGGLADAKAALKQALQWPAKYPQVFSRCPVKLTSGLLLYGMPGTGKTFLAKAVAQECSVRFIHVKGPELLNKYIGASEQAVRQVMARALAAQPCVVFFDEFDALAPRRGHDSTGVTDRVVNQLLTQLDGVEGREGVFVLAATSRPDLIDPALLRPGRLDKSILCPIPDQDQRHNILQCLIKEVELSSDVDLSLLARETHNFTGADLRALLFNAQLAAVHSVHDGQESDGGRQALSSKHLASALATTEPSLPAMERKRLDKLYSQFDKSRQGGKSEEAVWPEQRATLA